MIHLGKFEGVLLASDFDDTLVGSDCEVSRGNREALEYFVREGGRFTVSTGGPTAPSPPMWTPRPSMPL